MSKVSCESCDDLIEVFGNVLQLPYICIRCEKDSALAIEQDVWEAEYVGPACQQAAEELHGLYIEEKDNIPCDAPYNSGVPCQSALDSVQEEQFDMDANSDINQFDADTELINGLIAEADDLRMQLDQANKNVQVQGEMIADLENTLDAYRIIFRIPSY